MSFLVFCAKKIELSFQYYLSHKSFENMQVWRVAGFINFQEHLENNFDEFLEAEDKSIDEFLQKHH
jgi:hypothetical protein